MSEESQRIFLTVERATAFLKQGDTIHVFTNPVTNMLVGADWSRDAVMNLLIRAKSIEIGGEHSIRMKHGLVANDGERNYFIESTAGIEEESEAV